MAIALVAALALLLTPALASAESGIKVPHFKETFGSAAEPTFGKAEGMAVYQATGDVLVVDAGNRTVSRWHANGTPSNFSALTSTNVIDGHAGEADATPKGEILYVASSFNPTEVEIAVDNSGTATDGNIYVTFGGPSGKEVDIFASSGAYLGRLTAAGATAFGPYVCGVAVDSSGAVYVGASEDGNIYKYVPSGSFPVNTDKTAAFTGVTEPCQLAAGAGPTAGYLFAASYGGALKKLNSATGEVKYTVRGEPTYGVSVDPGSGYVYAVSTFESVIKEYDASGASSSTLMHSISLPAEGYGVAASGTTDDVYATRKEGTHVEVYAPYTVKTNIAGTGSGEVSSVGGFGRSSGFYEGTPPIECHSPAPGSGTCETALIEEPLITPGLEGIYVYPVPAGGSEFAGWTVNKGSAICEEHSGVMECLANGTEGDVELTATFILPPPNYMLTVTKTGSGSGTVVSKAPNTGINCGATCSAEFKEGKEVELEATAAGGSEFVEWSTGAGTCTGNTNPCKVTMSEAKSVNAKFDLITRTLTIIKTGPGAATSSVECKFGAGSFGACTSPQPNGTLVEVKATAGVGYKLQTITGIGSATGCTVLTNPCSFTITADSSVTAEFVSKNTTDSVEPPPNVHGNVEEATELGTNGKCADVDLGTFAPSAVPITHPNSECVLTVTATGEVNTLTAADPSATDKGHLTQKPTHNYSLVEPLKVDAESTIIPSLGGAGGGLEPLSSDVTLMTYNKPVSKDNVIVTFSQLIKAYESLHTGVYSKTITLTLNQTTP